MYLSSLFHSLLIVDLKVHVQQLYFLRLKLEYIYRENYLVPLCFTIPVQEIQYLFTVNELLLLVLTYFI